METSIVEVRVRHRIIFAPDPKRPAFGTTPQFVETRRVCDITEFPPGVDSVRFEDVVETVVVTDNHLGWQNRGRQTVHSEPFNKSGSHVVVYSAEAAQRLRNNHWHDVAVHPTLKGKVWVLATENAAEVQKNAA